MNLQLTRFSRVPGPEQVKAVIDRDLSSNPLFQYWQGLASPAPGRPKRIVCYATALAYAGVSALMGWASSEIFHTQRVSMIFLAGPLLAAIHLGAEAAVVAALSGFALYNFYLVNPRFTLRLAEPEDYFTLTAFLAIALLTGGIAGRLRDELHKSAARTKGLSVLFEASHELSASEPEAALRERLADKLGTVTGAETWVFGPGEPIGPAATGRLSASDLAELTRLMAAWRGGFRAPDTFAAGDWRMRPMSADRRELGSALWRTPTPPGPEALELDRMARVLTEVGATALARSRMSAEVAEAEMVAGAERLRTALLSSISHDFRTPLAAVLASATSLIEYGERFDAETRNDLLSNIQEEAERLNRFVTNLLNMTCLESGALALNLSPVAISEVAGRSVARLRRRQGARRLTLVAEEPDLQVRADPLLLDQVLTNLLENAMTFSPDDSEIVLRTRRSGRNVALSVTDEGSGVPEPELPRLFDKFYRGSNAQRSVRGSGLGLSICRGLVEAMGGSIEAQAREDGASGLCVRATLTAAT